MTNTSRKVFSIALWSILGLVFWQNASAYTIIGQIDHPTQINIAAGPTPMVYLGNGYSGTITGVKFYFGAQIAGTTYQDMRLYCFNDSAYTSGCYSGAVAAYNPSAAGTTTIGSILVNMPIYDTSTTTSGVKKYDLDPTKYYKLILNTTNVRTYGTSTAGSSFYYEIYGGTDTGSDNIILNFPGNTAGIIYSEFPAFTVSGLLTGTDTSRDFVVDYGRASSTLDLTDDNEISGGYGSNAGSFYVNIARTHPLVYAPLVNPVTYYAKVYAFNSIGQAVAASQMYTFIVSNNIGDAATNTDTGGAFDLGGFFSGYNILQEKYPFNWIIDTYDLFKALLSTTSSYSIPTAQVDYSTTKLDTLNTYLPTATSTGNWKFVFFSSSTIATVGNISAWPTLRALEVWILYFGLVAYAWNQKGRLTKIS